MRAINIATFCECVLLSILTEISWKIFPLDNVKAVQNIIELFVFGGVRVCALFFRF